MSYKLIIEKLWRNEKKFITRDELKSYSKMLKLPYESIISYLLSNGYLVRILRGIFYIKSIEEKKKKIINISFHEAIAEALKIKKITNWYFGLESAIKLNNLTHEYFTIDYIISDKLKRPRPIKILGHKVKFISIKKELLNFGIKRDKTPYSDIEKTILDIVYFSFYNNLSEPEIKNKIGDYLPKCNRKKLKAYSEYYPKTVSKFIEKEKT